MLEGRWAKEKQGQSRVGDIEVDLHIRFEEAILE